MATIVLNLKVYAESAADKAFQLAKAAKTASESSTHEIVVCPSLIDLGGVAGLTEQSAKFGVFSQHVDANAPGAFTGSVPIQLLTEWGVKGSLLNHSERRVTEEKIAAAIAEAQKRGFKIIVCARDAEEGALLAMLGPWAVAVEPPELIGSGISVSSAKPEVVSESVRMIKAVAPQVKVFVGAGVSNAADFKKSLELGAEGVLLASAFVKATDPVAWLKEFG